MTKIKLCGLKRMQDIEYVNKLLPEYVGFVFAPKSKRYVDFRTAQSLREHLHKDITPVGVFVNESVENIKYLVQNNIISMVQLHGSEDNAYISALRRAVSCPLIKAFRIDTPDDIIKANNSEADFVMLDSGGGTGKLFDHSLISDIRRSFFLAGGLDSNNVADIISTVLPYAVDASSCLETDGVKDMIKMTAFVNAVRQGGKI